MAFLKISMKLELESCSWLQSRFVMVALSQNELPLKIQFRRPIDLPPSLCLSRWRVKNKFVSTFGVTSGRTFWDQNCKSILTVTDRFVKNGQFKASFSLFLSVVENVTL